MDEIDEEINEIEIEVEIITFISSTDFLVILYQLEAIRGFNPFFCAKSLKNLLHFFPFLVANNPINKKAW
jgi:hypothetical protein